MLVYRFHIGAYEATKYKRENKNQRRFNILPTTCTLPPEVHKFWFNLCLEIAIANLRVRSVIQPLYIPYKCILLIFLPIIALNLAPTHISTPNNEQHQKGSGRSPGKTPRVWLNVRYTKLHNDYEGSGHTPGSTPGVGLNVQVTNKIKTHRIAATTKLTTNNEGSGQSLHPYCGVWLNVRDSKLTLGHLNFAYYCTNNNLHETHSNTHPHSYRKAEQGSGRPLGLKPGVRLNVHSKHTHQTLNTTSYNRLGILTVTRLLTSGDIETNPGPNNLDSDEGSGHLQGKPPSRGLNVQVCDSLQILTLNAKSIKGTDKDKTKLIEFRLLVDTLQPDIMTVSETWLKDTVTDREVTDLDTYRLYRKDREDIRGGGVIMLVKKTIWSTQRKDLESPRIDHNEIIAVEVRPRPGLSFIAISAYRSQMDPSPAFLENLDSVLTNCMTYDNNNFLILGDYNYPEINWIPELDDSLPKHCRDLILLCNRYDLRQLNYNPSTKDGNILDLVITNLNETFTPILARTYPFRSDHYLLEFVIATETHKTKPIPRHVFNFNRADMVSLKEDIISIDLSKYDQIDNMWHHFRTKIINALDRRVPRIRIKNKTSPPWIDADITQMSRQKHSALKKALKTQSSIHWDNFKNIRNRLKNRVNWKYKNFIIQITDTLVTKPKSFWNLLASRTKNKSTPSHLISNNIEITDPKAKATTFNEFFHSIFKKWDKPTPDCAVIENDNLSTVTLTTEDVTAALKQVDASKAQGPDGIPTRLLKDCAEEITPKLLTLFNASLAQGIVPVQWKEANVVPVFKKGDPTNASNYRPISLLPVISKNFERCIYNKIIDNIRPQITKHQHGFLARSSTNTQLLTFFSKINNILDSRSQCDIIYFDLSKAFDSVPHPPLLAKLKTFGICGNLHNWFKSYLSDRMQRVTLDGRTSDWLPVTSGVPQGSILGPFLFLLYINDLPEALAPDTLCAIFADDTKIGREIKDKTDATLLQNDVDRLNEWGESWGLKFNHQKCKVLHIFNTIDQITTTYSMANANLTTVDDMEDLGIIVSKDLKWQTHINKMCARAEKHLWLVIRTLSFSAPIKAKTTAYQAMIRSLIEYGSPIWSPRHKWLIKSIESIQRKATNFILCNARYDSPHHINYKTRLLTLNLLPASYRREILDLTLFLKSYHGKVNYDVRQYLEFDDRDIGPRTRQQDRGTRLKTNLTKLSSTSNFFPYRVCKIWNSLPDNIRLALKNTFEPLIIKQHLNPYYKAKLLNVFDADNTCTWISGCNCGRC